jgi:hypothetical protein
MSEVDFAARSRAQGAHFRVKVCFGDGYDDLDVAPQGTHDGTGECSLLVQVFRYENADGK